MKAEFKQLQMKQSSLHIPDIKVDLMAQKVFEMHPGEKTKGHSICFSYTIKVNYIHDFISAN